MKISRATFNCGHRGHRNIAVITILQNLLFTVKFAVNRKISQNLLFTAKNRKKAASLQQIANLSYFMIQILIHFYFHNPCRIFDQTVLFL